MADRKLTVQIVGDEKDLLRAFRSSSDASKRFAVSTGSILKGAVIFEGVRLGVEALGSAVRAGISEFTAMQKVAAQTQAVITSTGGVANVAAKDVQRLAGSLQSLSGIDDELIQSGANLILTFKNVRNELGEGNRIFDRATAAALDLSVAGFGSVDATAKQLGKALNDPVRGMAALGRAGVTFTKGQRDTIKALAESGRMLEAQKLILAEVESQVGGSAKALGDTLPGQLNKLREAFRNAFGNLVSAVATPLASVLGRFAETIPALERGVARLSDAVGPALTGLVDAFAARLPELQRIAESVFEPLRQHVGPVLQDVAQLVTRFWANAVAVFDRNSENISRILSNLGQVISNLWTIAKPTVVFLFEKALPAAIAVAIPVMEKMTSVVRLLSEVFVRVVSVIVKSLDVFLGALSKVTDAASHLPFVGDQFKGISDRINATRDGLRGFAADLDAINGTQVRVSIAVDTTTGTRREEGAAGHDVTPPKPKPAKPKPAAKPDGAVAAVDQSRAASARVEQSADKATAATKKAETAVERQRRAFDRLMGRLGLRKDAAEQTAKLADDLAVLRQMEKALRAQIRVEGRTVALARQLQDLRQERARLLVEQRQQRQFRALGLTATGDQPIPGVTALRRQLSRIDSAVEGTFLDTRKTESLLGRIRKVLSGGLGKVTQDVRETISRMLNDIDQQLKTRGSGSRLSRLSPINANKILSGLGLDEDQLREARQRLNRLGASAVINPRSRVGGAFGLQPVALGGGGVATVINVYGDIVTPDSDKFLRDMQKKGQRNTGTRSGVRPGRKSGV